MSTETKPENPPAFPQSLHIESDGGFVSAHAVVGMTLRDYFAAKAIDAAFKFYDEGYCGRAEMDGTAVEMVVGIAYELADAMLRERAKS
jgi:hypothetical protein